MAEALNNLYVKKINKRSVFNLLYWEKTATKKDLALKLGLSLPTVSQIMKELEEAGLVQTVGTQASSGGRKAKVSSIVNDSFYAVGIGISRHHIRLAALNLGQDVVARARYRKLFVNTPEYWEELAYMVKGFLEENSLTGDNLGVGMSLPGIVNEETGLVEYTFTLGVESLDIESISTHGEKGLPVLFGRDTVLAGKAEQWFRKSNDSALYLMLNNTVGGSIMFRSESLLLSPRSAEFGHMTIAKGGRLCSCGRRGCFEAYCSSRFLMEESGLPLDDFFAQLPGNEKFQKLWDEYLDNLAIGVNNLHAIFDLDVIIGGEMSHHLNGYGPALRAKVAANSLYPTDGTYLHLSNYSEYDAAVGAALLQIEKFLDL